MRNGRVHAFIPSNLMEMPDRWKKVWPIVIILLVLKNQCVQTSITLFLPSK